MPTGNPVYNMMPTTPPGWQGIPYMVGNLVAPMVGGVAHPYVPQNQSTADAWMSKYMVDPMYKRMMSGVYGQLGAQMGSTIGALPVVDSLARMTGYSASQMRRDLTSMGGQFGRSMIGSAIMPFADSLLNSAGLTGGSFVNSADTFFSNRMALMSSSAPLNPYNEVQQRSAVSGAAALMNLTNGLISQRDDKTGKLTLLPNMAVTQGFDRERIASLAVRMAGMGAFSNAEGGITERLTNAADGFDISRLSFDNGDFTGGGGDSVFEKGGSTAEKIHAVSRQFTDRMKMGIEAMGAMRDMLKEVDGIEEKLTQMTNGDWLRSGTGAQDARDAVRKMHAMTQMYNMDPKEAWTRMVNERSVLQDAAGITPAMQAAGFTGGGLFGISAQTEFMSTVESMKAARSIQNDPIKSAALEMQAVQAMARNQGTEAGRAAQILAYGRQVGALSEDESEKMRLGLVSGDRAVMGDTLNRLLTTVFGSAQKGREFMNDSMKMSLLREGLSNESGTYARRIMMTGADSEFMQREKITAANQRLSFSRELLVGAGMTTAQTPEGVDNAVSAVANTLKELDGGDKYSQMFKSMYKSMVDKGMKPQAALNATVNAFKQNPDTAMYGERIDTAVTRQFTENNEYAYEFAGGREASQVTAMLQSMTSSKTITSEQRANVRKMMKDNNYAGALAEVKRINSGLSSELRDFNEGARADAEKRYEASLVAKSDRTEVEQMISAAGAGGYGSAAVGKAYTGAIDAVRRYQETGIIDDLLDGVDKSGLGKVLGSSTREDLLKAVLGANMDGYKTDAKGDYVHGKDGKLVKLTNGDIDKVISDMGRKMVHLNEAAASTLQGSGYSIEMAGYWGGGLYSGNSAAIDERKRKTIDEMAQQIHDSSVKDAKDRNTLAQNFYSMMANKDWKKLIGVYDKDGSMRSLGANYFKKFEEYEKARDAYSELEPDMEKLVHGIEKTGNFKTANDLVEKFTNLEKYEDRDIRNMLQGNVEAESIDKIMGIVEKKRGMMSAQASAEEEGKKLAGDKDFAKTFNPVNRAIENDKETVSKYREMANGGIDVSKISEGFFASTFGSTESQAYDLMKGVVSDKEVLERLGGKSLTAYSDKDIRQTRISLTSEKAIAGDAAARKAMDKAVVASNEGVTRIKGEIIIKDGKNQSPGSLECVSETRL